jgi:hypothetical protein
MHEEHTHSACSDDTPFRDTQQFTASSAITMWTNPTVKVQKMYSFNFDPWIRELDPITWNAGLAGPSGVGRTVEGV